jgi:hypothetical protein
MPSKRKAGSKQEDSPASSTPAKRQRVSRACDQCRAAREKCDGIQPQCYSCVSLNRTCTYNTAPKKRGVQTGLIRTLEVALAWLFDRTPGSEEALNNLLTKEGSQGHWMLLDKDNDAGSRLHKKWRKSKVHKEIGLLLSGQGGNAPRTESSGDESETEEDSWGGKKSMADEGNRPDIPRSTEATLNDRHRDSADPIYLRSLSRNPSPGRLKLPPNFWRLLDIYFAYTNCWFPLLDQQEIFKVASLYSARGEIDLNPNDPSIGLHAELWSALAIASFQEHHRAKDSHDGSVRFGISPSEIYTIARSFISNEDAELGLSHIKTLLLLTLVKLGQNKIPAASCLVGFAVRTALQIGLADELIANPQSGIHTRTILAACFMLDTIVALRLGQTPHLRASSVFDELDPSQEVIDDIHQPWSPCSGFGSYAEQPPPPESDSSSCASSLRTFNQLFKFFRVLDNNINGGSLPKRPPSVGRTADLVQSLEQRFSFCNSVVIGGPTIPVIPSAFILQVSFLSASLSLLPGSKVSLAWNFMEVIENYVSHFGYCGTPPLFVTYMQIVNGKEQMKSLRKEDLSRWNSMLNDLQSVWAESTTKPNVTIAAEGSAPSESSIQQLPVQIGNIRSNIQGVSPSTISNHEVPVSDLIQYQTAAAQQTASKPLYPLPLHSSASPILARPATTFTHRGSFDQPVMVGRFMSHLATTHRGQYLPHQIVDYDAILDDLASIDCTDTMDADPQFMVNLGFAPGCDLNDMLQKEFGAI